MFSSDRGGTGPQLFRIHPEGTGETRVLQPSAAMAPNSWTPDGHLLVYQSRPSFKLGILPLSTGGVPHLFDGSRFDEATGQVSPNGRWLAYMSPEGGEGTATGDLLKLWNVYVQTFPQPGGKVRVSTNGATSPPLPSCASQRRPDTTCHATLSNPGIRARIANSRRTTLTEKTSDPARGLVVTCP
jgi:Tol biopolymer transport system component